MSSPAERYAAARLRATAARTSLAGFAAYLPFELDPFQVQACIALEGGRGVLVAAPTGAGKTVVGEFAIHLALSRGQKAFYTTPIKALSNQKYADLARRHGAEQVGLLTGDTTLNGDAPVVVMTTEVLRNMLYAGSSTRRGPGVQHVPEHLGGHHDHRCVAVEGGVPGEQADLLRTVPPRQVRVLLVAQRLDRRGVEGLLTPAQGQMDGKLPHDRLAGPGRCRDQDPASALQRDAGLHLERVELERQIGCEAGERGARRCCPETGGGVALGRGGHAASLGMSPARKRNETRTRGRRLPQASRRTAPGRTSTRSGSGPIRSPSAKAAGGTGPTWLCSIRTLVLRSTVQAGWCTWAPEYTFGKMPSS